MSSLQFKTYRNSTLGVRIKYPDDSGWKLNEDLEEQPYEVRWENEYGTTDDSNGLSLEVEDLNPVDMSLRQYASMKVRSLDLGESRFRRITLAGGVQALETAIPDEDFYEKYIYAVKDGRGYVINWYVGVLRHKDEDTQIFERMVESFRMEP